MTNVKILSYHFRLEVNAPFNGEYQKSFVYRFQKFPDLVTFVFDNLAFLEKNPYVIYCKDVVLETHTPSSFVDGLNNVD